jgi:hypothetical protein
MELCDNFVGRGYAAQVLADNWSVQGLNGSKEGESAEIPVITDGKSPLTEPWLALYSAL